MGQPVHSAPAEPVIELGELTGEARSDRDAGPPRPPRRLTLALVAVLVAAGVSGDATRVSLRPVLTTTFASVNFDMRGDVLYAFDGSYALNRVVAYRLRDGQPLWQVRSPATTSYDGAIQVGGRTLLVPDVCSAAGPVSTVAVDTATGREVWRRPGTVQQPINGDGLVLMTRSDRMVDCGAMSTPADAPPVYWDAVEAATGAVRWSIEVPEFARISFDYDNELGARWVVFVARDGTVTTRDLLTSAVTGQMVLAELAQPTRAGDEPGPDGGTDLMIAGSQVLVVRRLAGQLDKEPTVLGITAYDLVTLARRWTVRVGAGPSGGRDGPDYTGLTPCGSMLCLSVAQSTVFLEPRDGTERWRTSLVLLAAAGGRVLLGEPRARRNQPPLEGLTVRDVRTGKLLGSIPGWHVFDADLRRTESLVLGVTVGDRTWLAELDLARVRVLSRGWVPGWYNSCAAEAGYVACRRIDGSVRVWRAVGT